MAVRKSVKERLEEHKYGKASTSKTTTGSNTGSTRSTERSSTRESVSDRLARHKAEKTVGFDTFDSDLASVSETISKIYGGWQDADTMKNTKDSVAKMYERLNAANTYVGDNSLGELVSSYKSVLDNWDSVAGTYSQFQNADAYSSAKKNYELSEKYKGLDYAGVQKAKLNSEDADWLSEYGVNVGYSSLKDYNTELQNLSNKIASLQGEEKKQAQAYYDKLKAKANQYATENAFEKYSFLMENEDFEEKSTVSDADYSLWDMFTAKSDELDYMYINDEDMRKKINTASRLLGGNSGPFSAMSEQAKDGLNSMTDEEKAVYTYIYNTQGAEAARAYKEDMEVTWSKRESDAAEQQMSEFADKNAFNATVASALSVPLSIIGGTTSFVENSLGKLTGKEINPYNYAAQVQNASTAARETVGGNIAENTDWEIGGVNIAQFAYDTGLSVAESALGAATFGKGFTAIMGMSSASQKAKELKDAGATEEQIVAGSVASGLTEAAFEKLSIDNLLKPKSAETLLGVLRETAKQMGIEASEEMFTEIANTVSDTLIRQNTSDLAKSYEEYLYRGYTEEEAKKLVGKDIASNVMWSGIGGALSGGVMGGVSSGANLAANASLGSTIRENNNVSDLGEITSGLNNDSYAKYLELIESGKIKNGQLGGLYSKVSEEVDTNYQAEETNAELHAIANRVNEFGEGRNSGIIASAIQKKLNNKSLSSEERTALESDTAKAILQEVERGEITVERTGSYKAAYDTKARMQSVLTTPKSEEAVRVQKRVAEMNTGTETVDNESGQKIEIEGMSKDEEGNTVLQTSEGVRLLSDITLSDRAAEIVAMAEGMDDTKADTFVSLYNEGMDVEEYKTSFELAFSYGQNGFGNENVLKNKGVLTEEQAVSAYETGMRFATEARQKQIDEVTAKHFSGVTPGTFDDSEVDYSKINTQQKAAIDFSRMLSKATGVNIVFFQSEADENGHRTAENGRFDRSTNTVYLDVYAGVTENIAKDSIIPTLSHETTHWMKEKAPEAYKKLSGVVMDVLSKEYGVTPVDLVHAEMKRYKDAYGKEVSEEYAQDELIARASEDMLSGNRNVQEIISQMDEKTAKTFSERLKVAFEKIKEWLADLLSNYKSNSEEAKIVQKYADKVNELQEAWDEAFDKAIKANQVMRTSQETMQKAASDRVQYSERETIGGGLLSKSEFAQFYERLSDKKNGTKFPKDREGNFIFTIGNKLVYNNGRYISPKIEKVVTFNIAEDYGNTYTTFAQEEIIEYETDREYEGVSFEEQSRFVEHFIKKNFGREITIVSNDGYNHGRNAGNGLGNKAQVRNNLRINFENEQDGSGSNSESRGSESESVIQYSDRIKPEMDLAETIEQTKGMIAVHNLSEEKLLKTFSLGAFPMPSIAITKASIGHKGFGDISLLFRKDTIDPRLFRSNKVYSGDAWTPTYPRVSYKLNEKAQKNIEKKIDSLVPYEMQSQLGGLHLDADNMSDTLDRNKGDMVDYYKNNAAMKYAFLVDMGKSLELPQKVSNLNTRFDNELVVRVAERYGEDFVYNYNRNGNVDREALISEIRNMANEYAMERFGSIEGLRKALEKNPKYTEDNFGFAQTDGILQSARKYFENGITTRVDSYAARDVISENTNQEEYEKWLTELFSGIVEKTGIRNNRNLFTPSGNRRSWDALHYEETLENVIRAMKEDGQKGIGALGGNIFGASTVEFGSVEEIKEAGKKLRTMSHDEWVDSKQEFQERFSTLALSLPNDKNSYSAMDSASEVLVEAVVKYKTREGIANYLKKELAGWAKYSEQTVDDLIQLVNDIRNMPVNYFEAKPLRAVGFDEVAYAVIPDNASAKIREEISKHGIPMKEYAAGDEDARVAAVNSVEDVQFSNRDSNGNGLTREQIEYFKESKVRDAEGNLLVMYHGTPNAGFTKFRSGTYFTEHKWYADVYQSPGASSISVKKSADNPDTYAVYLNIKKPFDTRNKAERDIFYNEFYRQWGNGTDLMESGLPDWLEGMDLQEFIEENGYDYDGLILDEGGVGGYGDEVVSRGLSYVVFEPSQVKNIDNLSPTEDEDIRYSERNTESIYDAVGELKRLQKENEKLKKDVERLRQRNRLEHTITGGTVLNENQIASVASYLLKNADSTYSKEQLTEELKDIYKYLQSDDVTWDILMLKATDAAQRIVAAKRERTIPNDYAKEILYTLRNTKVSLNETQKAEAKYAYGKDWYKMYFGRVLVTNDGIPLDSMWQEWAQMYPDVFDADMSDADMATEVLNAYDAVKASSEIVEAYDRTEMEREIAVEIYNQFWNVSPVRTLADKYEKEIATLKHEKNKALYEKKLAAAQKYDQAIKQLKYEHRVEMQDMKAQYNKRKTDAVFQTKERYQKTIKELRTKRAEEIRQIKEKSKAYNQAYRDRLLRKAEIDKITNKALKLNTWLVKNSKEAHIPEILKKPVAAVLKSLNFSSERLLGLRGGEQAGTPTNKDISLSKAFEDLATMVANINDAQVSDKDITEMYGYVDLPADFVDFVRTASADINNLLRTVGDNEYILNEMTLDQLKDMDKIISTLSVSVTQMNKALAASHGKSIANLAQGTMQYTESMGKHKKHNKVTEWADNFLNFDNALPYYAFKMFGDGGQRIFEAFQDGWDKFAFNVKQIMDYSDNAYNAKEVKEWSKDIHEFDVLNGKENVHIKMTTAQIMSLYCLQKREQAKGHLIGGGIRVADFNDGKGNVSQPDGVTLQEKDIDRITAVLTDRQLDVADRLQEFMNTVCADWGNDVSMVRFGYKAFGEPNYFPITSDSNNLLQDDAKEKQNSLFRLLNMSFTKGTIKNANNRVVIDSIFDVFASHTSDMAKYNALALPVLDAFKWYNYKEKIKVNPANKDDKRFITKGVKQDIENAYGAGAKSYIVQFLRDINGAESGGITSGERLSKRMMSNYKTAAVGANLRVAILQPTAYLRASVVIDPKYLSKAMFKKPQIEKAKSTTGIALWKSMGFYDTNISKGVAEQIKHDDSWYDKTKEYSMKLAEIGDSMTWGYLYNACEAEVSEKQPGLTGKAKEEAIAKRLREVIYATQVVDSTMTRTQMMRNRSTLNQMLTSFMSEPMVSYNVLHDCYIQYEADKRRTGSKGEALKRNGKKISRAMLAYTLTTFVSALAGAIPDTLRDDEEEEDFATLFAQNAVENAMSDAMGMIPLLKDVFSVMQGYSATRMDQQYIASTWSAWNNIVKAVENGEVTYKTVYSVMKAISQITGIPVSNLIRDGVAIWNNTIGENYDSVKLK